MDKLPLISTPLSEAWPSWLMLGLLLCMVMAEVLQPETLRMSFRTTFSHMERIYGDSAVNFWGAVLLTVFKADIIALTLYLAFYQQGEFSILTYGLIVLMVIAFVAVKSFCTWLLSYTFDLRSNTAMYLPQYSKLWTALSVILYPIALIMMNVGQHGSFQWILVVIAVLFGIDVLVKLVQHYYTGLRSLGYIVLYAVTLEFIPAAAMVLGVKIIA